MDRTDLAEDFLEHYGVKGMKWGIRKDRSTASGRPTPIKVGQKKPGTRVRAEGGKNLPASKDAKTAARAKQKVRASTIDSLSNDELQKLVKRMNLEQQYNDLAAKQTKDSPLKSGQKFVKELLGVGNTVNQVMAFNSSPAGKALRDQLNKR